MVRLDDDQNSPTYGQYIDEPEAVDPGNFVRAGGKVIGTKTTGPSVEGGQLDGGGNRLPTVDKSQAGVIPPPGAVVPPPTGGGTPFTGGMNEFVQMFGSPNTPQELIALEQRLNAAGITIARNAEGIAGKIRLPNGQIIDIIKSAGLGGQGFQWLEGGGDDGGLGGLNQDYLDPFTTPFDPSGTELPQYTSPGKFSYPDFEVPDPSKIALDPSYQFRLNQGLDTIGARRSAQGIFNTGGTIKDFMGYGQGLASQEYGNIFDRGLKTYGTNRDNALGTFLTNENVGQEEFSALRGLSNDAYSRAWSQYLNLQNNFRLNQDRPYEKLTGLTSAGQQAASV